MDGLNLLTAAARTVIIGGRTYRLKPLTLADYGEIQSAILAARPDPRAGLRDSLVGRTAAEQRAELGRTFDEMAAARQVTLADLDQWWQTPQGFCYRFWLMVRKEQPWTTWEAASGLLRRMHAADRDELTAQMNVCDGWPEPWPPSGSQYSSVDGSLPWFRWAVELSRRYGWTPTEIAGLTIAQVAVYLGQARDSAARRHVPLADGLALCRQRDADREHWIAEMLETAVAPLEASPAKQRLPSAGLAQLFDAAEEAAWRVPETEPIGIACEQLSERETRNQPLLRPCGGATLFGP